MPSDSATLTSTDSTATTQAVGSHADQHAPEPDAQGAGQAGDADAVLDSLPAGDTDGQPAAPDGQSAATPTPAAPIEIDAGLATTILASMYGEPPHDAAPAEPARSAPPAGKGAELAAKIKALRDAGNDEVADVLETQMGTIAELEAQLRSVQPTVSDFRRSEVANQQRQVREIIGQIATGPYAKMYQSESAQALLISAAAPLRQVLRIAKMLGGAQAAKIDDSPRGAIALAHQIFTQNVPASTAVAEVKANVRQFSRSASTPPSATRHARTPENGSYAAAVAAASKHFAP